MTEKIVVFKSILGELISGYIKEKRATGYKFVKGYSLLKRFDSLVTKDHLVKKKLPKELVLTWTKKKRLPT